MTDPTNESHELFPQPSPEVRESREPEPRVALVHILTPEFHGLNEADFADISDRVVERASAAELQKDLYWPYVKKSQREEPYSHSSIAYKTANEGFVSVALTPEEYDAMSTSIEQLANRAFNKVLVSRDQKLQEATGDEKARARTEEDLRVANRGALRPVMDSMVEMQGLLDEKVNPKIELIEKFIEMTQGHNPNLARGTQATVSARFDELRTTVFDDMLDVISLKREWTPEFADRAKQIIQKRLYIAGSKPQRVANFKEMLALAHEYYSYKRALILTRVYEAKKYLSDREDIVADIIAVDEERQRAKEAKQLQLGEDE